MVNIKRQRSDASCIVANAVCNFVRAACLDRATLRGLRAKQRVPALCRSMVLRTSRRGRDDPTPPTGLDAMARSLDQ